MCISGWLLLGHAFFDWHVVASLLATCNWLRRFLNRLALKLSARSTRYFLNWMLGPVQSLWWACLWHLPFWHQTWLILLLIFIKETSSEGDTSLLCFKIVCRFEVIVGGREAKLVVVIATIIEKACLVAAVSSRPSVLPSVLIVVQRVKFGRSQRKEIAGLRLLDRLLILALRLIFAIIELRGAKPHLTLCDLCPFNYVSSLVLSRLNRVRVKVW